MGNPQYVMLILLDEAQPENPQSGNTAGWNAGEVSGRIIAKVAPMLGVAPAQTPDLDAAIIAAMTGPLTDAPLMSGAQS